MANRKHADGGRPVEYHGDGANPLPPPPRKRIKPLVRFILPSAEHDFAGRVAQLGIIGYHFDSYEDLARHPDCKYAFDVGSVMSTLTRRVESLNMTSDLFWTETIPTKMTGLPVDPYQYMTISADVFLMRYVSVVDCAELLTNEVFECDLARKNCNIANLKRHGVPKAVCDSLKAIHRAQGDLRIERNDRFHSGWERSFTDDDRTFRSASAIFSWGRGVSGKDIYGRKLDLDRMAREALVEMQREFNAMARPLKKDLDRLYDLLSVEFEDRFGPRIRASTHGLRVTRYY